MNVLFIMMPISILLAAFFVACFILSSKDNQFEDLESPSVRILSDGEEEVNLKKVKE